MPDEPVTALTPECGPHCGVDSRGVQHCPTCHDVVDFTANPGNYESAPAASPACWEAVPA